MTTLYIKEAKSKELFIDMSRSCIESFINSVDYTLCLTDATLGNVPIMSCDRYGSSVVADMDYLRTLDYDTNYNYIGN